VERRVKEKMPFIESFIVHIEPQEQLTLRIAIPIQEDRGLASPVTRHFGEAPYFLFVDVEERSVERWVTKRNPGLELERRRGITITDLITEEKTTTLLTSKIGEGPFHILRDTFVEIYEIIDKATADEAVNTFLEGKLKRMEEASEGEKQRPKAR